MKQRDKNRYRKLLEELETIIRERLKDKPSPMEQVADRGDFAAAIFQRELAGSLRQRQELMLRDVQAALHRLEGKGDDFGICFDCGEEIPKNRLDAHPHGACCAKCQAETEACR